MPLPLIIGGVAAAAAVIGAGASIHGGVKMKKANDTMKSAKSKQEKAVNLFNEKNNKTIELMDSLGKTELKILSSFEEFSDIIEKIQNRPEFKKYSKDGINLPEYEANDLKEVSTGAGVLLGGMGGAAAGTAGGFAAAGATTSAVMALGTASTGTAITSLSGVAATNATLAALGGGSLAAGGGGVALGTAVLGGATLGVGLLIGGIIFNATGSHISNKADEEYSQAQRTEDDVNKIVKYLSELERAATPFRTMLIKVNGVYKKNLSTLDHIVNFSEKTDWNDFTEKEKMLTENTVLLVGLLYKMCKVNLVVKDDDNDGLNTVNSKEIRKAISDAENVMSSINAA